MRRFSMRDCGSRVAAASLSADALHRGQQVSRRQGERDQLAEGEEDGVGAGRAVGFRVEHDGADVLPHDRHVLDEAVRSRRARALLRAHHRVAHDALHAVLRRARQLQQRLRA
eukprot:3934647-Rhodomonas_salina.2